MLSTIKKAKTLLAFGILLILFFIYMYVSISVSAKGWREGLGEIIGIYITLIIIFLIVPGLYFLIKHYNTIEIHLKTKKKITHKHFCPQCGSEIDPRTMYCLKCRERIIPHREDIKYR